MRKMVSGLAGAIVLVLMLSLLFTANVAGRYAPKQMPERATGPQDSCRRDADCWCAEFDGAEFIAGKFVQSTCNENGTCALCLYE
jgi:hypothetical protein